MGEALSMERVGFGTQLFLYLACTSSHGPSWVSWAWLGVVQAGWGIEVFSLVMGTGAIEVLWLDMVTMQWTCTRLHA